MTKERVIQATLKFGTDKSSLNQVKADTKGVGAALKEIDKSGSQADKTLQKLKDDFQALKERADRLAASTGPAMLARRLKDIQKEAEETKKRMQAVIEASNKMSEKADKLEEVGTRIAGIGAALAGPFLLAANAYVQKAGQSEEISRKWLATTERLSAAQLRIGKVAAEAILPVLEKLASLAETAAGLAEKHPAAVQAALGIGGVLVTLGGLAAILAQPIKLAADVKYLLASAQMDAAANKMLAASKGFGLGGLGKLGGLGAIAGVGLAGLAGAGLGAGGVHWLAQSEYNQKLKRASGGYLEGQTFGKYASVGAYGLGKLFGGEEKGITWARDMAKWTGEIADEAPGAKKGLEDVNKELQQTGEVAKVVPGFVQEILDKVAAAGTKASTTIATIGASVGGGGVNLPTGGMSLVSPSRRKKYLQNKLQQEQQKERQAEAEAARQEAQQAAQQEAQEQADRLKRIKDFNTQLRREEQDHQREMARLKQDHLLKLQDAERSRDASAFLREKQEYNIERERAIQDYTTNRKRQKQDFQTEMGGGDFAPRAAMNMQQRNQTINFAPQYNFAERDDARMIMGQVEGVITGRFRKLVAG